MASFANCNILGAKNIALLAFLVVISTHSTTSSHHHRRNVYLRIVVGYNQLKESRDQLHTTIAEDRNLGGVIRHSEINSVSGMEDILGDVSDFNQDQISDVPQLMKDHLRYLNAYQDALRLFQLNEIAFKLLDDSMTTYEGNLEVLVKHIASLKKNINIILQTFDSEFDSEMLCEVAFGTCDASTTTCATKRGLYIMQELDFYLSAARRNFVALVSS